MSNKMSDNPVQNLLQAIGNFSNCIQACLSSLTGQPRRPLATTGKPFFSISWSASKVNTLSHTDANVVQPEEVFDEGKSASPVSKEELGRATWTFLHTLAAQYPDNPTRQQKRDVKELLARNFKAFYAGYYSVQMAILSRIYPCKECADHFKEVLRANPMQVGCHSEFSQWLCHVHNVVNRSLGKLVFPCERVYAKVGQARLHGTYKELRQILVTINVSNMNIRKAVNASSLKQLISLAVE